MSHLMNTYARQPVAFTHGEGVWLFDSKGKRYLDALSGIAVNTLGHAHPRFTAALIEQIGKLMHCSNVYQVREQEWLADKLCELSAMQEAFLCNSGCEANEAAIKLARMFGHSKGIDIPNIIVMEKSFHGRTLATLSATGNRKVQAGFEPLVKGFVRVPYDDLTAVEQVAANNPDVVAILVEPIQGEGGIRIPDAAYLQGLRKLCDANGWLLILDEVQSGIGRTGKWFAIEHSGVAPDLITMAKSMAGGFPISAVVGRAEVMDAAAPGGLGNDGVESGYHEIVNFPMRGHAGDTAFKGQFGQFAGQPIGAQRPSPGLLHPTGFRIGDIQIKHAGGRFHVDHLDAVFQQQHIFIMHIFQTHDVTHRHVGRDALIDPAQMVGGGGFVALHKLHVPVSGVCPPKMRNGHKGIVGNLVAGIIQRLGDAVVGAKEQRVQHQA